MPRLREVLYSGQISEGAPVYEFEMKFSAFVGLPNILSFYSGTAALHMALLLAGVKAGDEVISTPMTAEPTNMAIRHAGGRDRLGRRGPRQRESLGRVHRRADHFTNEGHHGCPLRRHPGADGRNTGCRRASRGYRSWRTRPMPSARATASDPIGAASEYAMFSLQAIKHMTTVDGGMLACKDPGDLPRGRELRWFGIDRQAPADRGGCKQRWLQVSHEQRQRDDRARPAGPYRARHRAPHRQRPAISIRPCGRFPDWSSAAGTNRRNHPTGFTPCWRSGARISPDISRSTGLGIRQVHKRNDLHSVFASSRRELPGLDSFYSRMLHIPCGWWVSEEDRDYIAEMIRRGW